MTLKIQDCLYEGICIARIKGRLVMGEESSYFRQYFQRRLEDGVRLFIVDTDGFQFIDSTGMGDIASAFTRVKMRTGRIVWISPTTIQPAYQLARFEKGIEIVPDLAAALQALTGHAVKVPSQLQYEDRYTVSMKEEGHAQKLVVDDRMTEPPKKTEYVVQQIPPTSGRHLSLLEMAGVAFVALALLALLIIGLVWVTKQIASLTLLVLIFSVAVLFYITLVAVVLLVSGHLSEKMADKLFTGVLGKIPGLARWIPKAAGRKLKN